MNRVGADGRGESIWLGWFLHATLKRFAALAVQMKDDPAPYLQQAEKLSQALEAHAWDGDWYLRAFYDDGEALGSHENSECRIDSIAQSWAVLSEAGDPKRAAQAMESVNKLLVKQAEQMILLFTPPFDKTGSDPGYIKGYLPGVRENGGQYTHAAIWTAWAFAKLGQGDRAGELFHLLNPISHADTPEKVSALQGGAICHRRRYLQPVPAHRDGRLDMVHRLLRLDVPPGDRSHPGHLPGWVQCSTSTLASPDFGRDLKWITASETPITRSAWRTRTTLIAASGRSCWMETCCPATRSR